MDRNQTHAPNLRLVDRPLVQTVPHRPPAQQVESSSPSPLPTDVNLLNAREMAPLTRPVTVLVDSRDRNYQDHPHPHAYTIRLPHTLHGVTHARLVSCELPTSFYVFKQEHGTTGLSLTIDGVTKQVFIPDGNYSFEFMSETLKSVCQSAFPGYAFQVSFDSVSHKCRIQVQINNAPVSWSVDTRSDARLVTAKPINMDKETGWGLAYFLGFERDQLIEASNGIVEGSRPAVMFPERYILIDIRGLGRAQEAGLFGEREARHTFAKIPFNVGSSFTSVFFDKALTTNSISPPILNLRELSIEFRFHDRTPVDFHSFEHSLTLEFMVSEIQAH